jgi:hypothetical protein
MPTVFVEGVGRVAFPDSMSPAEIEAEIKKMEPPKKAPEMGAAERFGRGALQSVTDIGYGLRQLSAEAGAALGAVSPQTVARLRAEQDVRAAEAAPFMESGAGQLGYMAGSLGTMLIPGAALGRVGGAAGRIGQAVSAPRTLAGAAAVGGTMGAVQPVGTQDERSLNVGIGAIGGMAGQAAARGLSRLAQPTTSQATPQVAKAVSRLEKAGVPVDIAEQAGSENLRMVRRFLTDNPISAGAMKKGQEATQTAFNRAALKLIGEQGDAAVPEVLSRADDRIGSVMDDIAKRNKVKVDNQMVSELAAIEESASMSLEPAQLAPLRNQINNILSKLDDQDRISGEAYQRIRTLAADMGKNPALAGVSKQLRETVDSALERTAGKADADALKLARKQYRNLMKIKDAVGLTETGDISIPRLASATSTKRERGAALMNRGDADMARLARSAMTVRDAFPQSGTAPRAALQTYGQALAPGLAGAAYGVTQGETPSDAATMAIAGGLLGLGAPAAAARAYQNPALRDYILRGVQNDPLRRAMLSSATRSALTYGAPAGLLAGQ